MWHVSSRSVVATLRTAIHLLLTYLLKLGGFLTIEQGIIQPVAGDFDLEPRFDRLARTEQNLAILRTVWQPFRTQRNLTHWRFAKVRDVWCSCVCDRMYCLYLCFRCSVFVCYRVLRWIKIYISIVKLMLWGSRNMRVGHLPCCPRPNAISFLRECHIYWQANGVRDAKSCSEGVYNWIYAVSSM